MPTRSLLRLAGRLRLATGLATCLVPVLAAAQYKCQQPNGSVSFQQTPCPASQKQQALHLPPGALGPVKGPAAAAASGAASVASGVAGSGASGSGAGGPPPAFAAAPPPPPPAELSPDQRLAARYRQEAEDRARAGRQQALEARVGGAQAQLERDRAALLAERRSRQQDSHSPGSTLYDEKWQRQRDAQHDEKEAAIQRAISRDQEELAEARKALDRARFQETPRIP